jgi:excisionase family DNA binding protein
MKLTRDLIVSDAGVKHRTTMNRASNSSSSAPVPDAARQKSRAFGKAANKAGDSLPTTPHLTLRQVAEHFAVSVRTVQRWIERGWLKPLKIGGLVRITAKDLMDFEARHQS